MKMLCSIYLTVFSLTAFLLSTGLLSDARGQGEPYYKGKQIRIVVGLSTGGGYDRAARLVARHMPKYIPGNPDMVV